MNSPSASGGEKGDEVLVFSLGLGQAGNAALLVVGIRDRQLGLGKEFAVRVGVDERLERQPAHLKASTVDFRRSLLIKDFVGLIPWIERIELRAASAAKQAAGEQDRARGE